MASLPVYNAQGKEVARFDIEPTDLAPRINKQLLHDAVVMYQANLRQGSAKTKSRAEVSASTKKLYRQKGTGNARAGARSSGIRRGGGHIFAIRPRDYSYRLPRKALQLATRMAVAAKLRDGELVLIDQLSFDAPKTKAMAAIISALKCDGQSLLVTTEAANVNVYKSGRNIDRVTVTPVSEINALSVIGARRVLMTKAALESLKARAKEKTHVKASKKVAGKQAAAK